MGLRGSRFNFASTATTGSQLLLNGITGALCELDDSEWSVATQLFKGGDDLSRAPAVDEIRGQLRAGGFLVEEGTDEAETLVRRSERGRTRDDVLEIDINPTWSCNARCTYCYVQRSGKRMPPAVVRSVGAFLRRGIPRYPETRLSWAGGEPLLRSEIVIDLTALASEVARASGARLSVTVLSNGLLLDSRRARALEAAGVTHVHVTVDGLAETHDRARPAAGGRPSWGRTMANLRSLVETTETTTLNLRINVEADTLSGAAELLERFEPWQRARMQVDLSPVLRPSAASGQVPAPSPELQREITLLARRAIRLGYRVLQPRCEPKTLFCTAEKPSTLHIGPDGTLMKCHDPSIPEALVGRLDPEGREVWNTRNDRWSSAAAGTIRDECRECRFLCFCGGGCRLRRLRQTEAHDCRAWFADLEGLIANRHLEATVSSVGAASTNEA